MQSPPDYRTEQLVQQQRRAHAAHVRQARQLKRQQRGRATSLWDRFVHQTVETVPRWRSTARTTGGEV